MRLIIYIKNQSNLEKLAESAENIIEEVEKMQPNTSIIHTDGTNIIIVENTWKGSQIFGNLQKIVNNDFVAGYETISNPIAELKQAVQEHDIFKAYSLGYTLLETYATKILKKYF